MPDMPEHIAKGSILKKLDELSRDRTRLRHLRDGLNSTPRPKLEELAYSHGIVNETERDHLRNDWFTYWWTAAQPVEEILAEGFTAAIEQAWNLRRPLDCYWVCYGEVGVGCCRDQVEFATCISDRQITVVIQTPAPPPRPQPPLTEDEPILLTKRLDDGRVLTTQIQYGVMPDP